MIRINFNNPFTKGKATPEEKARILELNNKVREVEEEKNQKEQEMSQGLTSLSGEEKLERMREIIALQNEKREHNRAKIDLEREIREGRHCGGHRPRPQSWRDRARALG